MATTQNKKSVFADRLKSARLMNGFSLQDLSDALDIELSRQALYRYEKGEVMPDSEKINVLSKALHVNPDFFYRQTKVELGKVEYRKLKNMPKKVSSIIEEKTKEYLSRYLELEEILGISTDFKNPLKNFSFINSFEQIEKAAEELRQECELGQNSIYNVMELLEDHNVKVVPLDVNEDFDGLQTYVNGNIPVIAYNTNKADKTDRLRMTLLHELGHLLLDFGTISYQKVESLCYQFAAALLLPEKTLKSELGEHRKNLSITELGYIKMQYGISMQAIVMRARDCGIINSNYTKQFFFYLKQMNWKVDEPSEYDYLGLEKSNRFEQLLSRALIEGQISQSKAAALSNQSVAEFRENHQAI